MGWLALRPAQRASSTESGFTLVEVVVAMVVLLVAMSGLLGLYGSNMKTIAASRERQNAAALAQDALEALRALPYDTVQAGAVASQLDTDIASPPSGQQVVFATGTGPATQYHLFSTTGEQIAAGQPVGSSPPYPLTPTGNVTRSGVPYALRTYVTATSVSGASLLHATAIVAWQSAVGGAKQYSTQTAVSSDIGCGSSTTHPFAAPCQHFFRSAAGSGDTAVTVTTDSATQPLVTPNEFGELHLGTVSGESQTEQVSAGWALTQQPWVYTGAVGTTASSTVSPVRLAADNDPSSSAGTGSTQSISPPSAVSTASGDGRLIATSSPEATTAGVAASAGAVACPLPNGGGSTGTGVPCDSASATLAGLRMSTHLSGGLGNLVLAEFDPAAGVSEVAMGRLTSSGGLCSAGSAIGCSGARVRRVLPQGYLAGVPGSDKTSALIKVDPMVEDLWAEAGSGAAHHAPSRLNGSGTPVLSYRTAPGASYTNVPLQGQGDLNLPAVNFATTYEGSPATATVTPNLRTAALPATLSGACSGQCKRELTADPVLSGDIEYVIRDASGGLLAHWTIDVDYGGISAIASFQEAPSAN